MLMIAVQRALAPYVLRPKSLPQVPTHPNPSLSSLHTHTPNPSLRSLHIPPSGPYTPTPHTPKPHTTHPISAVDQAHAAFDNSFRPSSGSLHLRSVAGRQGIGKQARSLRHAHTMLHAPYRKRGCEGAFGEGALGGFQRREVFDMVMLRGLGWCYQDWRVGVMRCDEVGWCGVMRFGDVVCIRDLVCWTGGCCVLDRRMLCVGPEDVVCCVGPEDGDDASCIMMHLKQTASHKPPTKLNTSSICQLALPPIPSSPCLHSVAASFSLSPLSLLALSSLFRSL